MSELIAIGRTWLRRTFAWTNSRRAWLDRISISVLTLGVLGLALFWGRLSNATAVAIILILLATLAVALRQGWTRLLGPILFYDLVTTARRNRFFIIRYVCLLTLVGLLLFVNFVLGMMGSGEGGASPADAQKLVQVYFVIFVVVQSVFLIALTPAYVAGSIAEEKERQTLEFVLATDLQNREIVFGKLVSRLANLLMIFMSGIPILSILQFLGGIDPIFIVSWAAATGVALVSLSSLCLLNSVLNRRARDAIALSYFCIFGYLILSGASWFFKNPDLTPSWISQTNLEKCLYVGSAGNPIVMAYLAGVVFDEGGSVDLILTQYVRDFAIFHATIAVVACIVSVLLLRVHALGQTATPGRKWFRIHWPRPPVLSPPLIWKEIFVEKGLQVTLLGRILFCLLLAVAGAILYYLATAERQHMFKDVLGPWIQTVGMLGACLLLLTVGGRAATSMSSERDRGTLDGLLTAPLDTDSILFSKWVGAVFSIRWGMLCLTAIYVLGVYVQAVEWYTVPLMILAWFVYSGVAAMLGLWYSVSCPTSTSATVWTYLSSAGLALGHWLDMLCMFPLFLDGQYEPIRYLIMMQAGFTPPFALTVCFFYGIPGNHDGFDQLTYGLEGLAVWLVIAVVLWLLTSNRFLEQSGRSTLTVPLTEPGAPLAEQATDGGLAAATNG
jgi:ABC-type transport system involved in multi-copper enzyme maturation permease subunit